MEDPREHSVLQKVVLMILVVSLGVHALSLVLGQTLFESWWWMNVPLHSTIEAIGSMIAFAVASLLLTLEIRHDGTSYNSRIAAALVGMGLLDGFHAMVYPGDTFVWFHSTATFVGGFLFSLVWLPTDPFERIERYWVYACGIAVLVFGLVVLRFPGFVPGMIQGDRFSFLAHFLNVSGGLFLILASTRLFLSFRRHGEVDDLLFSLHCLLFGAAGLMFPQSTLWDFSWWGWHFLRMMAYGAALVFAVNTLVRDQNTILERKETLEKRVTQRTSRLEQALREKETLLKEIHHRVKNNMQFISSMLSLQSDQVSDPSVREKFQDSLGRINSMALVHDLLYQSDDLEQVDFENYVSRLVDELRQTLSPDPSEVQIETSIENVYLDIDTAVLCGLIINELVMNSLQHAFSGQPTGSILISFDRNDDLSELTVEDNGVGIDERSLADRDGSLGLELVRTIVEKDLLGEMTVETDDGTIVTVRFKQKTDE